MTVGELIAKLHKFDSHGPWVIDSNGGEIVIVGIHSAKHEDGCTVCEVNTDLLEACEGLLKALNIAFDRCETDLLGVAHNDAVDAMSLAEQAIAKAKGPH